MDQSPLDEPPPAYGATSTETDAIDHPPQYTFPTSVRVGHGNQTDGLFVTLAQIKGHLALLNAFDNLKRAVAACQDPTPQMPPDVEKRWAWFVNLAAERFDRWVRTLKEEDKELSMDIVLPPIDILMVWHAYMLNPRWYAEDAMRIPSITTLFGLGNCCIQLMDRFPDILSRPPSAARVNHFAHRVAMPFNGLISASHLVMKSILCPYCCRGFSVSYMEEDGTGYFQAKFLAVCPNCTKTFTKEQLRARKLAENLASLIPPPGTVLTDSPVADQKAERVIKANLNKTHNPATTQKLLEKSEYSLAKLRAQAGRSPTVGDKIRRVMSAHLEPMIYSVELAGAVMRQGNFVDKMENFGWTRPGFFDRSEDEVALQHAVARYHAFLHLMASSPDSFFVPTLDIDLVWHTHQLFAEMYRTHCDVHVGKFVDHDDKVDTFQLSNAFDNTCKAWKTRFGIDYAHCRCPLPEDALGKRLSLFRDKKKPSQPQSHLSPPVRGDSRAATHASEHNSVIFVPQNNHVNRDLMKRYYDHNAKMTKREKEKKKREQGTSRGADDYWHDVAFLYPVPNFYPAGGLGCVATQSGLVNHGGACGNGNGRCGGGGSSS